MSLSLISAVSELPGVGPVVAKRLAKLGIVTIEDLLWHLPFRYDDFRSKERIAELKIGQTATVEGTLELIANRRSPRKWMIITQALMTDDSGSIQVVWFNQGYLAKNLKPGDRVMLSGRVESRFGSAQLVSPSYEKVNGETIHVGRLVPVYPTTTGLSQRQLRFFSSRALTTVGEIPDPLPQEIKNAEGLPDLRKTLGQLHFPRDEKERDRALRRLKFDELLLFQLRRQMANQKQQPRAAPKIPFQERSIKRFVHTLPFSLTNGQRRAAWQILKDCAEDEPMNRLLEGDVGSGKTVVAALAAANALAAGFTVALMVPTEILARQHFLTFSALFKEYPFPLILWTHGFREIVPQKTRQKVERSKLKELLRQKPGLLIGTHALLDERLIVPHLGLVIVDEQQRFGVQQRETMHRKNLGEEGVWPHFLSLTATPIPRTLALALAGDLRLSFLRESPAGRKPIITKVLPSSQREKLYQSIDRTLANGRQAFVLAPLIEPSDRLGVASATNLYRELVELLPHRNLGLLHGKLSSSEKDLALADFVSHKTDLLVATAVVEVGIDVPNATVMVIEGAERFGLAQLHQLRGRIGRGKHQSVCFLISGSPATLSRKRLTAVAHTNDGFALAELDLKLRGPGDLVGTLQAGFLDFRFASLGDHELIEKTAFVAKTLLTKDPELTSWPELRQGVGRSATEHQE